MTNLKHAGKTTAPAPASKPPKAIQAKAAAKVPATVAAKNASKSKAALPAPKPVAGSTPTPTPVVAKPKHKLVRDSFTIPKSEYAVLDALKLRAANLKRPTKKSEVLRAGIGALAAMSDKAFLAALESVPVLKTGRPQNALRAKP
ncbi:hypothetical protein BH11PSE9_BH11PSE9_35460 [soil metagenome]